MVQKQDVSDWIQTAMKQDIDGFKAKNPNIDLQLELVPGFTTEFIPKILALTAGGQLGDVTWYAPAPQIPDRLGRAVQRRPRPDPARRRRRTTT